MFNGQSNLVLISGSAIYSWGNLGMLLNLCDPGPPLNKRVMGRAPRIAVRTEPHGVYRACIHTRHRVRT